MSRPRYPNPAYLGDGVYVYYGGYGTVVELTTEDGVTTTNRIVLEESVLRKLNEYVAQLPAKLAALRAADEPRVFLTKVEATHRLGLACAAQPVVPDEAVRADARVAVRVGDQVFEAQGDEALHSQVILRVWRDASLDVSARDGYEAGWTIAAEPETAPD